MLPRELRYTRTHEWVRVEGDRATVGITDFAQQELGDVVFVDLPDNDEKVEAGDMLASIESLKTISDVHVPVSGVIIAVNDDLEHSPEFVNQDPYGKGWIAVIELSEPSQLAALLSPADYEPLTDSLRKP